MLAKAGQWIRLHAAAASMSPPLHHFDPLAEMTLTCFTSPSTAEVEGLFSLSVVSHIHTMDILLNFLYFALQMT